MTAQPRRVHDTDAATMPASATRATSRYVGGGRIASGAALLASLATGVMHGHGWFEVVVAVAGVGLVGLGLVMLWPDRVATTPSVRARLDGMETALFALLIASGGDETTAYVAVIGLLMLVLAAMRGRRAFRLAFLVALACEVVRQATHPSFGLSIDVTESLIGLGLAAAVGMVVARLVDLARSSERLARESAAAATTALADAEQAILQLDALHRVVASGIGADEHQSLERVVREVATSLDVPWVYAVLLDEQGRAHVAATTDPDVAERHDVSPIPGGPFLEGPLARVLSGEATMATQDELDAMAEVFAVRGAISAHPLRRADGTVVGALACGLPAGGTLSPRQHQTLGRFADQTSLAIEAARSLDREADLARRYRELDRMKTDFIAVTSHELRTPLTTILGVVEMLDEGDVAMTDGDRAQLFDALRRQTRRLEQLVDDLSTVSTVDAGTLAMQCRPTDVVRVVTETTSTLFRVDTELHVADDVPHAHADPDRLAQVVTNLVVNGDQHGSGTVHLAVQRDDGAVVLRVWDEGPGIPPGRRHEVFDRFVRLGETNSHSRGTGLGLAIARELTEAMHGTVGVVDHSTGGSAFEVRLQASGRTG